MNLEKYETNDSNSWIETLFEALNEKIGQRLNNIDWDQEYCLYCVNNDTFVNGLEDLITIFENRSKNNTLKLILKVKSTIVSFGFYFILCFFLCIFACYLFANLQK